MFRNPTDLIIALRKAPVVIIFVFFFGFSKCQTDINKKSNAVAKRRSWKTLQSSTLIGGMCGTEIGSSDIF